MNVVSAVANLQKELDYYKEISKEQAAIIKQLVDGPGEFEYIHPWDVADLLNELSKNDTIDFYKGYVDFSSVFQLTSNGKKYRQSVHIPAKTKSIK